MRSPSLGVQLSGFLLLLPFSWLAAPVPAQATSQAAHRATPCLQQRGGPLYDDSIDETSLNAAYAVECRNDGVQRTVTAIEVLIGQINSNSRVSLHRADAVSGGVGDRVAAGVFRVNRENGWQGAVLSPPRVLQPNETFWIAISTPRGAQLSVEGRDPVNGDRHSLRSATTGLWQPPVREFAWKWRVYCGGKQPGEFSTRHIPCGGPLTGTPQLSGSPAQPQLGGRFTVRMQNGRSGQNALWLLGLSDSRIPGVGSLPLFLDRFGAPGCQLGVTPEVVRAGGIMPASGIVELDLDLPVNGAALGLSLYVQGVTLDSRANRLGLLTSDAARLRLGN